MAVEPLRKSNKKRGWQEEYHDHSLESDLISETKLHICYDRNSPRKSRMGRKEKRESLGVTWDLYDVAKEIIGKAKGRKEDIDPLEQELTKVVRRHFKDKFYKSKGKMYVPTEVRQDLVSKVATVGEACTKLAIDEDELAVMMKQGLLIHAYKGSRLIKRDSLHAAYSTLYNSSTGTVLLPCTRSKPCLQQKKTQKGLPEVRPRKSGHKHPTQPYSRRSQRRTKQSPMVSTQEIAARTYGNVPEHEYDEQRVWSAMQELVIGKIPKQAYLQQLSNAILESLRPHARPGRLMNELQDIDPDIRERTYELLIRWRIELEERREAQDRYSLETEQPEYYSVLRAYITQIQSDLTPITKKVI